MDELVKAGWEAVTDAQWAEARDCFERAYETDQSADVVDGLARSLHFLGEYERAIDLTERAFVAYVDSGDMPKAADTARWLAFLHGTINGNFAVAGGWMARAGSLLADYEECAAHGWVTLDTAVFSDDQLEREQLALAALAIAQRFGDRDLEYDALALLGDAMVASGHVAEGMRLIDEAMTAVSSGEVADVVAVSDILCRLLGACERALDVTRAEQWMRVARDFGPWREFVPPVCRSHYGGILIAVGRWPEAEDELLGAIEAFKRSYRGMSTGVVVKLADLRVRQGRFEEARRLLDGNEAHPVARRALAAIALAGGEAALAEDLARMCVPSDGPVDPVCAPALELVVEACIARGDVPAARAAAAMLGALDDERAAAFAALAAGRIGAAEGDARARHDLQAAHERFAALELPLEAARAQLELSRVMASGSSELAVAEARSALKVFERLGATPDADAAAALLRRLGASGRSWPKGHGQLTKREEQVLALLADGCSNEQIAQRLVISRRTAEHHVASILSKLGLRSRAEAAAYVAREDR